MWLNLLVDDDKCGNITKLKKKHTHKQAHLIIFRPTCNPIFLNIIVFLILKKIIRTGGSITPNSFERKFQQLCDSEIIFRKKNWTGGSPILKYFQKEKNQTGGSPILKMFKKEKRNRRFKYQLDTGRYVKRTLRKRRRKLGLRK